MSNAKRRHRRRHRRVLRAILAERDRAELRAAGFERFGVALGCEFWERRLAHTADGRFDVLETVFLDCV